MMRTDITTVFLTLLGSALCWLPLAIRPNGGVTLVFPLAMIGLCACLSSILNGKRWPWCIVASAVGAFLGSWIGMSLWPPGDPIARPLVPIARVIFALLSLLVSAVAVRLGLKLQRVARGYQRSLWVALIFTCALSPALLALTPSLVIWRIRRNEQLAEERFLALKHALETVADNSPSRVCMGSYLKPHYAGPPFRDQDWEFIAGNYIWQDGYAFGLYCLQFRTGEVRYALDVGPAKKGEDGLRSFCTDQTRNIGCRVEEIRYACLPCPR